MIEILPQDEYKKRLMQAGVIPQEEIPDYSLLPPDQSTAVFSDPEDLDALVRAIRVNQVDPRTHARWLADAEDELTRTEGPRAQLDDKTTFDKLLAALYIDRPDTDRDFVGNLKSFAHGAASTVTSSGTFVGGLAEKIGLGEGLLDISMRGGAWLDDHLAAKDPSFMNHLSGGLGSMASFFIPSLGAYNMVSKSAMAMKLAKVIKAGGAVGRMNKWAGAVAGSATMAAGEGIVEAGSVMQESLRRGEDIDTAFAKGNKALLGNIGLLAITDAATFLPAGRALKIAVNAGLEALEEGEQTTLSEWALGDRSFDIVPRGTTEMIVGGIIGGGVGLASSAMTPYVPEVQLPNDVNVNPQYEKDQYRSAAASARNLTDDEIGQFVDVMQAKATDKSITDEEFIGLQAALNEREGRKLRPMMRDKYSDKQLMRFVSDGVSIGMEKMTMGQSGAWQASIDILAAEGKITPEIGQKISETLGYDLKFRTSLPSPEEAQVIRAQDQQIRDADYEAAMAQAEQQNGPPPPVMSILPNADENEAIAEQQKTFTSTAKESNAKQALLKAAQKVAFEADIVSRNPNRQDRIERLGIGVSAAIKIANANKLPIPDAVKNAQRLLAKLGANPLPAPDVLDKAPSVPEMATEQTQAAEGVQEPAPADSPVQSETVAPVPPLADEMTPRMLKSIKDVEDKFIEVTGGRVNREQAKGLTTLIRAAAEYTGRDPDTYVQERIADIQLNNRLSRSSARIKIYKNGQAIIEASKKTHIGDFIHELGHLFMDDLSPEHRKIAEKWAGVKDGKWTKKQNEDFAKAYERYHYEGIAPNEAMKRVFEQLKNWLRSIYKSAKETGFDRELTPEIRKVFDDLMTLKNQGQSEIGGEEVILYKRDEVANLRNVGEVEMADLLEQQRKVEEQANRKDGLAPKRGKFGIPGSIADAADVFYQKFVDRYHLANKTIQKATGKTAQTLLEMGKSPVHTLQGLASAAPRIAEAFVMRGVQSLKTQGKTYSTVGLDQVIGRKPIRENYKLFGYYLKDRRLISMVENIPDKVGEALMKSEVPAARARLAEDGIYARQGLAGEFYRASQDIHDFNRGMMDFRLEMGLLNQEQYDRIIQDYPFYVPLKLVEKKAGSGKGKGLSTSNVVDDMGMLETMDVIHPVESSYRAALLTVNNAVQNMARQQVADLIRDMEGGDAIGQVLGPANRMKMKENQVTFIDHDGVQKVLEVDPHLFRVLAEDAFKGGGGYQTVASFVSKYMTSVLRTGAVATPEFGIRNFARDTMQALVIGGQHVNPLQPWKYVARLISSLKSTLKMDQKTLDYILSGAVMSEFHSLDRQDIQDRMKEELSKARKTKGGLALYTVRHPMQALWFASQITESVTRMAVYTGSIEKVTKDNPGLTWLQQQQIAGMMTRDSTIDFNRAGEVGMVINRLVPFFNAGIQGQDKLVRALFSPNARGKKQAWFKAITMVMLPSLMLWDKNKDEEWYNDLESWEKNMFWWTKMGNTLVRIPKPFELGLLFGSLPERILEEYNKIDPRAVDDWMRQFRAVVGVDPFMAARSAVPPLSALNNIKANYDHWRDAEIVRGHMNKIQDNRQAVDTTSRFLTWIGPAIYDITDGKINMSPIKAEYFIKNTLGGLGTHGLDLLDHLIKKDPNEMEDIPFIYRAAGIKAVLKYEPDSWDRHSRVLFEYVDRSETSYMTIRRLIENRDLEGALEEARVTGQYFAMYKPAHRLAMAVSQMTDRIESIKLSALSPQAKRAERNKLVMERREAIQKMAEYLDSEDFQKQMERARQRLVQNLEQRVRR